MIKYLVVVLLFMAGQVAEAQDVITLDNPDDVADMIALNSHLDGITEAVMACMDGGKDNVACQCESKTEIHTFDALFHSTLDSHSEWEGQSVYYVNSSGEGVTTSFVGLQRQSDLIAELDCSE